MDNNISLALLIPLLPLLGFVINGIGFGKLPKALAGTIGTLTVFGSFLITLVLFGGVVAGGETISSVKAYDWITITDTLNITFEYRIDSLSIIMMLLVTGVGTLIHLYSFGYMSHDKGMGKFFAFLNLFIFSMLILVMGSDYVTMFIGWEGVGLCSFLLIGFWNQNRAYNAAAQKAFVMNRIGDLGFLAAIFLMYNAFGTSSISEISEQLGTNFKSGDPQIFWITLCLFIGAMGKSAQVPLYTWLPDAMAGPTPVSALIHAATMVTAGIYMVVRSNVLFSLAPDTLHIIAWIGCITAVLGASIGLFQNDIKKVLAYSTVSQLGFMFMALGVAAYSTGMFHVLTHAFFKALLFLGAGSVIHAMSNEQDIRKMGGLWKKLPITFWTFLIGTIAISGIPPFAGFFSKDEILANLYTHDKTIWILAMVASFMTSFYMFRLLFLTFFGSFRGTEEQKHHLHESPLTMTLPLMLLAVLSMVGGFMGLPAVFSEHHMLADFLGKAAGVVHGEHLDHNTEFMLMGISVAIAVVGLIIAFVRYGGGKNVPVSDEQMTNPITKVVYNKYYVDELYNLIIVKPLHILGDISMLVIEYLVIDLVVNGIALTSRVVGLGLRKSQTGSIGFYMYAMVIGIILFLAYFTMASNLSL